MKRQIDILPALADKGRDEDTYLAHVAAGERVIPPVISPELQEALDGELRAAGLDPNQYRVGDGMSINPETGLPEFGFWKKVGKFGKKALKFGKKIIKPIAKIAPIATSFIPGIGWGIGAAIGAAGGALSGGGLKGALLGGVAGGLGAGGAGALAGRAGLGAIGTAGLKGAISGAGAGAYLGGGRLRGALMGAGLGGVLAGGGAFAKGVSNGGLNNIGIGTSAGAPLSGGVQGATRGSGFLGSLTRTTSNIGGKMGGLKSLLSGGGSGGFGSGSPFTSIYSGINQYMAADDLEDQLAAQQQRIQGLYNPYMQSGQAANQRLADAIASGELGGEFKPGDLTQDPGYQYQLEQGEEAINRANAASGSMYSGAALKELQRHSQGLADSTYQNAYNRWMGQQQNLYNMLSGQVNNGLYGTQGLANSYSDLGDIQANATLMRGNAINSGLTGLLSGRGFF